MRIGARLSATVLGATFLGITACGGGSGGSGGSGGGGGNAANEYDAAAQTCVDKINEYRSSLKLAAYERWVEEETCTNGEAKSDSESGKPHGAFGSCGESAQNECPGWSGPPEKMISDCLSLMWSEGPGTDFSKHGHYINMSNPNYKQVSCGFHVTSDGQVWATQNFK
jgi:hypothetical protein